MRYWLRRVRASVGHRPLAVDAAATALLAGLGVMAVRVGIDTSPPGYQPPATATWVLLTLALVVPLAWRRRFPLTVLVVVTIVFFPYRILDVPDLTVSVVVWWLALYSAGAYGHGRWRDPLRAVNVVSALGFLAFRLATAGGEVLHGPLLLRAVFFVLFNVAFVIAAWVFGDVVADRRRKEQALLERATQLEFEREDKARRAVFDERVRIARELHDVVAHHVSVMGVQAGAARRVMDKQPVRAAEALSMIEQTSRQAVVELQRTLRFLRQEGEPDGVGPQPRIRDLEELLAGFADTGVDIRLSVSGVPEDLPASLDVSAYRIVQEALTNVLRHSTAQHVRILICGEPCRLTIQVTDDGQTRGDGTTGPGGHGLVGMRERVTLHRGHLRAGPLPDTGFQVRATFPLDRLST